MCKANRTSVLQEVKGLMEHICRLEGEIIDHIQTIGEHRDSLKALRAFYNRNGRAPRPDDISKMIDVVKEQILADLLEYGDMQSADEGMDMTDSSGPIHVVNFFAELRRKWSREAARKEARLAGEMEDNSSQSSEVDEREHIPTIAIETDADGDEDTSSTPSLEPTDIDSDSLEGST